MGGPRLLDIFVGTDEIEILVTGPGMLFDRLELVTNLSALDGCTFGALEAIAADLEGISACGHRAPEHVDIRVEAHRTGPELVLDLGPASMYQSVLTLRTRSGQSFRELLRAAMGRENLIAALQAVRATAHHEHHHSASRVIRDHAEQH